MNWKLVGSIFGLVVLITGIVLFIVFVIVPATKRQVRLPSNGSAPPLTPGMDFNQFECVHRVTVSAQGLYNGKDIVDATIGRTDESVMAQSLVWDDIVEVLANVPCTYLGITPAFGLEDAAGSSLSNELDTPYGTSKLKLGTTTYPDMTYKNFTISQTLTVETLGNLDINGVATEQWVVIRRMMYTHNTMANIDNTWLPMTVIAKQQLKLTGGVEDPRYDGQKHTIYFTVDDTDTPIASNVLTLNTSATSRRGYYLESPNRRFRLLVFRNGQVAVVQRLGWKNRLVWTNTVLRSAHAGLPSDSLCLNIIFEGPTDANSGDKTGGCKMDRLTNVPNWPSLHLFTALAKMRSITATDNGVYYTTNPNDSRSGGRAYQAIYGRFNNSDDINEAYASVPGPFLTYNGIGGYTNPGGVNTDFGEWGENKRLVVYNLPPFSDTDIKETLDENGQAYPADWPRTTIDPQFIPPPILEKEITNAGIFSLPATYHGRADCQNQQTAWFKVEDDIKSGADNWTRFQYWPTPFRMKCAVPTVELRFMKNGAVVALRWANAPYYPKLYTISFTTGPSPYANNYFRLDQVGNLLLAPQSYSSGSGDQKYVTAKRYDWGTIAFFQTDRWNSHCGMYFYEQYPPVVSSGGTSDVYANPLEAWNVDGPGQIEASTIPLKYEPRAQGPYFLSTGNPQMPQARYIFTNESYPAWVYNESWWSYRKNHEYIIPHLRVSSDISFTQLASSSAYFPQSYATWIESMP